ncbi:MAG: CRISPR system precrRNA processing endoribonuclease RAMP protein Cas6 [Longimonas sp.]|uniref:CRISPR system precrRNA processing endoribonuclease RAMP protein Cas6 n=1 Tax=Longimonas sp. TaxID=2039626 RepID=UPI003975AEE6
MSDTTALSDTLAPLNTLTLPRTATLRLAYKTRGRVHLTAPPASVWRGQLGEFLHRIAPEHHHNHDLSLYQQLFRTPRTAVDLPNELSGRALGRLGLAGEHVPHPFVMRMHTPPEPGEPLVLPPNTRVQVDMVLVEEALAAIPSLTAAFDALGAQGLGKKTDQPGGARRRGRVQLAEAALDVGGVSLQLYNGTQWSLPPRCDTHLFEQAAAMQPNADTVPNGPVTVQLRTPLRLKHARKIVRPDDMSVPALCAATYRRLVGLAVCYSPKPPTASTVQDLLDAFFALGDATTLDASALTWATGGRYSHRQGRRHPISGLMGPLTIDGPAPVRRIWRTFMKHAEALHLGKKTALGLGRVVVAS